MKNGTLKLIKILSLAFISVVCLLSFIACGDEEESCTEHLDSDNNGYCDNCNEKLNQTPAPPVSETPAEKIVLNKTLVTLDVFEQLQLTVESGNKGTARWTSSNPEVAKVSADGLVETLSAGTSEIVLTNENGSASCYITVENSYSAPIIILNNKKVEIAAGDEYILAPVVKYKGEDVTAGAKVEFSLADGAAEGVVSLLRQGKKATARGAGFGNTVYVVYAEYNGISVSTEVEISVKNFTIAFDAKNLNPQMGGYTLDLSLIVIDGYVDRFVPNVLVIDNKTVLTDADIVYVSENPDVVKIENGEFIAAGMGSATVTGSYEGNSFTVYVSVIKPTLNAVALNGTVEVGRLEEIAFDRELIGTLTSAKIGGVDVGDSITDGKLTLSQQKLYKLPTRSHGKNVSIVIETTGAIYNTTIDLYSLILRNEADYRAFGDISKAYFENVNIFGGYFILGNSFTVTGGLNEFIDRNVATGVSQENKDYGFVGVIDGQGYSIDGLSKDTSTGHAFVTLLNKDGVIRNIGFTNVSFNADFGTFLVHWGYGLIQNVYIQYKEITNSHELYSGTFMMNFCTYDGVIVDASKATVSGNGKYFNLMTCNRGNVKYTENGYICILPEDFNMNPGTSDAIVKIDDRDADYLSGKDAISLGYAYRSYLALQQSKKFANVLTWDPLLWHINETTGEIVFGI